MNEEEQHIRIFQQQCEGGFDVPNGFFEKSKQQLLLKTNNGGFGVPEKYFEEAKTDLLKRVTQPNKTFVLKSYWKYAAAAILLLSIGLYWYLPVPVSPELADLNEDEIINYVVSTGVEDYTIAVIQPNETAIKDDHEEELIYQIEEDLIVNEL